MKTILVDAAYAFVIEADKGFKIFEEEFVNLWLNQNLTYKMLSLENGKILICKIWKL